MVWTEFSNLHLLIRSQLSSLVVQRDRMWVLCTYRFPYKNDSIDHFYHSHSHSNNYQNEMKWKMNVLLIIFLSFEIFHYKIALNAKQMRSTWTDLIDSMIETLNWLIAVCVRFTFKIIQIHRLFLVLNGTNEVNSPFAACIVLGHCSTVAYQNRRDAHKSTELDKRIHVWSLVENFRFYSELKSQNCF